MSPSGIRVLTLVSEPQNHHAHVPNPIPGSPPASPLQRTLSYNLVSELLDQLVGQRYCAKPALYFEVGHVVSVKLEQSITEYRFPLKGQSVQDMFNSDTQVSINKT